MLSPNFFTQVVEDTPTYGKFILEPLSASFGQSMGNSLRRILLSSLEGAAITDVKIEGAPHLFTTLKGVKESVLDITLNLKQVRLAADHIDTFRLHLSAKKKGKIYARDITGEAKVVNGDLYIGEITDSKGSLEIEAIGHTGVGYWAVEERDKKETDFIPIDASFSPIKKVSFYVEEARVGRKTNLDRLVLEIWTDGSMSPLNAFKESKQVLSDYFNHIFSGKDTPVADNKKTEGEGQKDYIDKKLYEVIIDELNLPSRVINALLRENIETVADLVKAGRDKLTNMKGVGKKSIELIDEELKKMGIELE